MNETKINEWRAFLSWPDGYIATDPGEQAEMFEDARGEISIRRGSALPDEDGKLPGSYFVTDVFMELDLEMFDSEVIPAQWELAQRAAWGMNQPVSPPWSWTPPAEPGPEVRRLRPVEQYAGDNSIWYDREPDNSGWRLVMRGRPGGVIEWLQVLAGAGSVFGGRQLVDATAELEQTPAEVTVEVGRA